MSSNSSKADSTPEVHAKSSTPTASVWNHASKVGNSVDVAISDDGWREAGMTKTTPSKDTKDTKDTKDIITSDVSVDTDKSKFPVYIIHSKWPITEIEEFIDDNSENGYENDAALLRIDYFKGESTDRTIVVLKHEVYQTLRTVQVPGFAISPFKTGMHWHPKSDENERCFFVKLPPNHPPSKCRKSLLNKLQEMVDFGIIGSTDNYNITIPLKGRDRESSEHTGQAYIEFNDTVELDSIVTARVLLAFSYWDYRMEQSAVHNYRVCCYYKKNRSTPNRENHKSKDTDSWQESHSSQKNHEKRERVTIKIPTIDPRKLQDNTKKNGNDNPFDALNNTSDNNE